jgi:hypothetical protein
MSMLHVQVILQQWDYLTMGFDHASISSDGFKASITPMIRQVT